MQAQNSLRLELITTELDAAARAAHEVRTRLHVAQKMLLDVPQVVTVDDVTALYAAFHAAEALEHNLRDLSTRLQCDIGATD